MKHIELKNEVIRIAKKADELGLCRYKSGNFSVRDKEKELVYITPSGISREELTIDKIAVVDLKGNIVDAPLKPSIETSMHLNAYRVRPDAVAVAHSHSRYASIFACMGKEILPVSVEALHYGGEPVKVAEFGPPGSNELAQSIVEPLQTSDVCLLKYHGVIAIGDCAEKALLNLIYVEEIAFLYYHLLKLGQKEFLPQKYFKDM